jgi:hypothetical protein
MWAIEPPLQLLIGLRPPGSGPIMKSTVPPLAGPTAPVTLTVNVTG